jgi:stress response protein YsnF
LNVGKRVVNRSRAGPRLHGRASGAGRRYIREQWVAVGRRPVDRHSACQAAFKDRTIDVTTHREEPVIAKEARVKEEVVVRQEADQRTETVRDTVRHTEVEVEDDRAKARAPASPSVTPRP